MYGNSNLYGGHDRRGNPRQQIKKYFARSGDEIWLDISIEAFRRAGFEKIRHGDKILDPHGDKAIAIGFAKGDGFYRNKMVLWYHL